MLGNITQITRTRLALSNKTRYKIVQLRRYSAHCCDPFVQFVFIEIASSDSSLYEILCNIIICAILVVAISEELQVLLLLLTQTLPVRSIHTDRDRLECVLKRSLYISTQCMRRTCDLTHKIISHLPHIIRLYCFFFFFFFS